MIRLLTRVAERLLGEPPRPVTVVDPVRVAFERAELTGREMIRRRDIRDWIGPPGRSERAEAELRLVEAIGFFRGDLIWLERQGGGDRVARLIESYPIPELGHAQSSTTRLERGK